MAKRDQYWYSHVIVFMEVFALLSFSISFFNDAKGQNYSSETSKEFESIRTSLDQAIAAFNEGNLTEAYELLEKTQNQTEIVESRIIFELGIE